jgi:hypothetical protein
VAAPAFSEVMTETLRLLHVPPDYIPEPPPEPARVAEVAVHPGTPAALPATLATQRVSREERRQGRPLASAVAPGVASLQKRGKRG